MAAAFWEVSLKIHREQEGKLGTAASLNGLGLVAYRRADYAHAQEWLDYSLALSRESKDRRYISLALNSLGRLALAVGDQARAAAALRESLVLRRDMGDRQGLAETLETLAQSLAETAPPQPERAARVLGAAHALRQAICAPVPAVDRADYEQLCEQVRALCRVMGEAVYSEAWAAGERLAAGAADKLLEEALPKLGPAA